MNYVRVRVTLTNTENINKKTTLVNFIKIKYRRKCIKRLILPDNVIK